MKSDNLINKEKPEINQLNKINSKDTIFKNLKNDFFLEKIFNNLNKKKSLVIVKYNKNIKKRINININDYKEYSGKYSSIEIEIKPVSNKYGQFINIKKEDKNYYHIYFNNNKKEIKRNYIKEGEQIKIIKIIINYQIESLENLFYSCKYIESINFKKFFRNNMTNMSGMFYRCSSLKELNLNNFKTNNVVDMSMMFSECSSLKELNLNNFNTNNVTNISYMFYGCLFLKELNLNNFNINEGVDMYGMFIGCPKELITKIKTQYTNFTDEAFMHLSDFLNIN